MSGRSVPVLAAQVGHFTFHGEPDPALDGIGLSLAPGTLTAILGGSGSGKSTLGRLLAGWLTPGSSGEFEGFLDLSGTRLDFRGAATDPRIDPAAWCRRVGFVPQDAAALLSTVRATVAEELAFGLENVGMNRPDMQTAVHRVASLTGLDGLLDRDPAGISGGEQRRLAIGCAVITRPAVLILDEPYASLDADGAAAVTALVRNLAASGTAVVVLSQRVDIPLLGADHWLVLSRGKVAAEGSPAELAASPELAAAGIIGAPADRAAPARLRPVPATGLPAAPARHGVPALELRDVSFTFQVPARRRRFGRAEASPVHPLVLDRISLSVYSGEIVAITGPNGAGKSTLLRHLNGLLQPVAGSVRLNGQDIAGLPPGEVACQVGLLFQDPRDQLFERTAEREVGFGLVSGAPTRPYPRAKASSAGSAAAKARRALAAVGLADAAGKHPAELPASQQRLLALATVLARKPRILALDEPTVALDRHGLGRLDAAVRQSAAEGAAVVLVTHDLAYAHSLAHRAIVLHAGRLEAG